MTLNHMTILLTGAAGFIGSNLAGRILADASQCMVVGLDSMNDYYDPRLKEYRLSVLEQTAKNSKSIWKFINGSIADKDLVDRLFEEYRFDIVVNLAAQAGVRHSISHPDAYIESNLVGFHRILEACRHSRGHGAPGVQHLVYASSSSVYGGSRKVPFHEEDQVDTPVSLYAATKKSDELMAYAYAKLYDLPVTGLRFFTVYGPAGRPDMAYFGFADKLRRGQSIQIYNYGNCKRDFTYIDDVVEGIMRVMLHSLPGRRQEDGLLVPPYKIYNVGHGHPENLLDFVTVLQQELVNAEVLPADYQFELYRELVPMQPGDVPETYADTSALERDFGYKPGTDLRTGLRKFALWYKDFYGCGPKTPPEGSRT